MKTNTLPSINSFLSPAYWGSFASFIIGLFCLFVISVINGPPEYIIKTPISGVGDELIYYCTLSFVCIYIIRYYSAVSVQVYSGSEESLFFLPSTVRKVMFMLLSVLILLCGINSILITTIGVVPALFICSIQSLVSLFCLFGFWIAKHAWPGNFSHIKSGFRIGEIFVMGPVVYLLYCFHFGMDSKVQISGLEIGLLTGLVIWFSLHEWVRLYHRPLAEQFSNLLQELK